MDIALSILVCDWCICHHFTGGNYYSENAKPLGNVAIRAGRKSELSAPGVSETSGRIESVKTKQSSPEPDVCYATSVCRRVGGRTPDHVFVS